MNVTAPAHPPPSKSSTALADNARAAHAYRNLASATAAHLISHSLFRSPAPRAHTKLAAKLIISATTVTLKKNETMACRVVMHRNSLELMETSEVCEAAPNDVEK